MTRGVDLTIECVTEAFLHVEPGGDALWRVAPFRGLSRWWGRALLGASLVPPKVREREAQIFGTSKVASPVVFRIRDSEAKPIKCHVNPGSKRSALRWALAPGSWVRLQILPANRVGTDSAVSKAYAALWTAIHLGGIGQRSRRGAGGLRICGHEELPTGWPQPVPASTPEEYAHKLAAGIGRARDLLDVKGLRNLNQEAEFPVLHPKTAVIAVAFVPWGAAPGGVKEARRALMNHRRDPRWHKPHAREPEFGFVGGKRLASPLWIRFAEVRESKSLVVFSLLKHGGAKDARWNRAENFMRSSPLKRAMVDLED